jgi:hypothetical protein
MEFCKIGISTEKTTFLMICQGGWSYHFSFQALSSKSPGVQFQTNRDVDWKIQLQEGTLKTDGG